MRLLLIFLISLLASPALAGEKWALLVGVDEYETRQITPLNYAVRDITAVAKVLEQTEVPKNNIFLMTDKGKGRSLATGTNIIWRLGWLAQRMQPDDTLYFYFSGHGIERGGNTYLLSYDSDIGSEITLKRTAVRMAELREIAKTMKASTIITFMDACRNDPEAGKSVNSPNSMSKGMAKDLALVAVPSTEQRKTLNVTFYSCSPGERSWESEETSQGFFSYHVMKGLLGEAADAQGRVTVNSLEDYLSREVPDSVDRMIGQIQTPWTHREGTAGGSFVLAQGRRVENAQVPEVNVPAVSSQVASVQTAPATTITQTPSKDFTSLYPKSPTLRIGPYSPLPPLSELRAKAESGDGTAQLQLGMYYMYGKGGEWDRTHYLRWFKQVATSGQEEAKYFLALEEGPAALAQLAREGNSMAMADVALRMYVGFSGFEKDEQRAMDMFKKAVQAGDLGALSGLVSSMPDNSEEKRQLEILLKNWLQQSESDANIWHFQQIYDQDRKTYWINKRLELSEQLAKKGELHAIATVGLILTTATGYSGGKVQYRPDASRGVESLKSIAPIYPDAATGLGFCYEYGAGTNKSKKEARKWYQHAAKLDPSKKDDIQVILNNL